MDGTLAAIRRLLRPGGRALLGDTIWEVPPTPAALAALEGTADEYPDLAGLVHAVRAAGFEPGYGHVSTLQEWDDDEFGWTGALTDWALREAAGDAERVEALDIARSHRDAWLRGYRGQLGFVTLVLTDTGTGGALSGGRPSRAGTPSP